MKYIVSILAWLLLPLAIIKIGFDCSVAFVDHLLEDKNNAN